MALRAASAAELSASGVATHCLETVPSAAPACRLGLCTRGNLKLGARRQGAALQLRG